MLQADFKLKPKNVFKRWGKKLKRADKGMARYMQTDLVKAVEADVRSRSSYPGPVVRPIEWANIIPVPAGKVANIKGGLWSKQKAAYFATDGFGAGIPYIRKGTFYDTMAVIVDGKVLTIANKNPIAQFVTSPFQQPFHSNTGWEDDRVRFAPVIPDAIELIRDRWIILIGFPKDNE